jgi:hypothetical protein
MFGIKKPALVVPDTHNYNLQELVKTAAERNKFTPDIWELERSEFQRVFIYDEMKHGHRSNAFLPEELAERDATCYTESYFVLHKKQLGQASQAIATDGDVWPHPFGATAERARIQGEMYVVFSSHIPVLDTYHQNTIEFERRRVRILRPWRHVVKAKDGFPLNGEILESFKARGIVHSMRGCATMDAWMYVGRQEYWGEQLARQFTPVKMFTSPNEPWLKEYYAFTQKEYET